MNDNNLIYSDTGSTLFMWKTTQNAYTRFLIKLNINSITELSYININIGNNANRNPHIIKFYLALNYNRSIDLTGNNDALVELSNHKTVINYSVPTDIRLEVKQPISIYYIIKKDNKNFCIKDQYYNDVEKKFNSLNADINILSEPVLYMENNIKNYITDKTISGETFRPIEKFDKFNLLIKKR